MKYVDFAYLVMVLEALEKPRETRELLDTFHDYRKHKVLKVCEEKGLVERKRVGHKIVNSLTKKGMGILQKYHELLREIE